MSTDSVPAGWAFKHHYALVYNVTHSDLILGVDDTPDGVILSPPAPLIFVRPKFSFFEPLGRQCLNLLEEDDRIIATDENGRNRVVGFGLKEPFKVPRANLHARGSAQAMKEESKVAAAYIPLATQLISEWIARVDTPNDSSQLHVLLVCGRGRPQDVTASLTGNSTRATAEFIAHYIKHVIHRLPSTLMGFQVPPIDVQIIDSSGFDVFDMDDNVSFVRTMLMPRLEAIRRQVAITSAKINSTWRSCLEVTLALTEGSPARVGALSAALRPYRPWYAHMYQLKTFWHERNILSTDVRFYGFDRAETSPPMVVQNLTNPLFRSAVAELAAYRDEFLSAISQGTHELQSFWLRKSQRPVLCILAVVSKNPLTDQSAVTYYRGINSEVSQPTGSLCSERNAIGTALAANPGLNRRDLALVAVLALPALKLPSLAHNGSSSSSSLSSSMDGRKSVMGLPESKRARSESVHNAYTLGEGADVNPLGPCGACVEWLRKIAELNPDFRVMTFRDTSCRETFLREVD